MNLALCTLDSTLGSTSTCFPMTYSHIVGRWVDIRRRVGRHSFITGVVSTIHCLSATVCVGGEVFSSPHLLLSSSHLIFSSAYLLICLSSHLIFSSRPSADDCWLKPGCRLSDCCLVWTLGDFRLNGHSADNIFSRYDIKFTLLWTSA